MITSIEGDAQESGEERKINCRSDYKLLVEVPMYECMITGLVTDTTLMVAEPGSVFTVVNVTDENVVIRFWEWKENKALTAKFCFADSLCLSRKYYAVSDKTLCERVAERFNRDPGFTAGTVLIPFKLRLQKFDFSKDVTLGPAAGVRFRLSHYSSNYVDGIIGTGITSVTLDGQSTDGTIDESSDAPALTPFLGFVFELSNVVQAGLFCGWDFISHNNEINFIYQGKTWLSIGLGYSLISFNEEKAANKQKKKP
jgi:hypothetical protein